MRVNTKVEKNNIKVYKNQLNNLESAITSLKDRKSELEAQYEIKIDEESRAKAILKKQQDVAVNIYQMKKNKITDKAGEAVEKEALGERAKGMLDCYHNVEQALIQEIAHINQEIENKKQSAKQLRIKINDSIVSF